MNSTEQILIRLGVDATAVDVALGRVGNRVKAWGVGLVNDLKGTFGRLFSAGLVLVGLEKIKDRILEISRAARETGTSTTFIQGLQIAAARAGLSFEDLTERIAKFNKLLGQAKMGDTQAVQMLADMHVITDKNSIATMNFSSAMHNLSIRFDQLNDRQKQAYLLSQAFGRGYASMMVIFEGGTRGVDALGNLNPFLKITPGAISDITSAYAGLKTLSTGIMATIVNLLHEGALTINPAARVASVLNSEKEITNENLMQVEAEKEGITVQELKNKLKQEEIDLTERSAELSATINDRDKQDLKSLAAESRKLLGIKSPLQMSHTVTPRMREALNIDNLEERATLAWRQGNDRASQAYQSEADRLRASAPWLKRADQNPMLKTEIELQKVNTQLQPISRAAALIKE